MIKLIKDWRELEMLSWNPKHNSPTQFKQDYLQ